jgi:hypothetical protein
MRKTALLAAVAALTTGLGLAACASVETPRREAVLVEPVPVVERERYTERRIYDERHIDHSGGRPLDRD